MATNMVFALSSLVRDESKKLISDSKVIHHVSRNFDVALYDHPSDYLSPEYTRLEMSEYPDLISVEGDMAYKDEYGAYLSYDDDEMVKTNLTYSIAQGHRFVTFGCASLICHLLAGGKVAIDSDKDEKIPSQANHNYQIYSITEASKKFGIRKPEALVKHLTNQQIIRPVRNVDYVNNYFRVHSVSSTSTRKMYKNDKGILSFRVNDFFDIEVWEWFFPITGARVLCFQFNPTRNSIRYIENKIASFVKENS